MRAGSSRRQQRGQAAVEAALGILVVVTILVFGIHFAEVGYMSIKVAEAANHATFDATARQHHRYSGGGIDSSERANAASSAASEASDRYSDYDGRESYASSAPDHVFTEADDITVQCEEVGVGSFTTLTIGGGLNGVYANADQGGMRCYAQGQLNLVGIGSFQDSGGGFFKAQHVASGVTSYTICGFGRASGGSCDGAQVPIALGDWGLSDTSNNEAEECDLYNCTNTPYKDAVETAFNNVQGPTGLGQALAVAVAGYGTDEAAYWFTFRGEESGFRQALGGVHNGDDEWTVTPGGPYEAVPEYQAAHGARQAGFLGFPPSYKYSSRP